MVKTVELLQEIRERLLVEPFVRVPTTLEEYEAVADEWSLDIEYHNGEIIAALSQSTPKLSRLRVILSVILSNYYITFENNFSIFGKGLCIYNQIFKNYYQPDLTIIDGEIKFKQDSTTEILNPYIVVEVLSKVTQGFDMSEKLVNYKTIETIKQIIFVAQDRPWISTFTRTNESNVWINTDYDSLENIAIIDNLTISLRDIYKKIF